MTTIVSLKKLGNSRALIIPSKMLKGMNVTEDTRFEMSFDEASSKITIRKENRETPSVRVVRMTEKERESFLSGLVTISEQEKGEDDRLAYILGK